MKMEPYAGPLLGSEQMRSDSIGIFWEDIPEKRGQAVRPQPPIPETGWRPPQHFPDLSSAPWIGIDCETYEPEFDYGPGWARGVGHIVGVSVSAPGLALYFPIRHTIEPEYNLDPAKVLAWLNWVLSNPNQPKIGANLLYDVGWLRSSGVNVKGQLFDVQFAESLLIEEGRTSLDTLGEKYVSERKDTNLLYKWCQDFYGGGKDQRKNIWRAPPRLVGPYAEQDARLPPQILERQTPLLIQEGLWSLFRMECDSIDILVKMRMQGVRVNVDKAEQLRHTLQLRETELHSKLDYLAGMQVDINSSVKLAKVFDKLGLSYGHTEKGNPSFTKQFLAGVQHPITDTIAEIRKLEKLRGTFLESYILNSHKNGIVYGQFHPLRGDEGGTRSGRYASSTPNLQNVPARDEELAPMIRGIFIPFEGHQQWRKYDYSQIEYRFLVHFASGKGSDEARAMYCNNPKTDYHEFTLDLVSGPAGWDVSTPEKRKHKRRPIKNINFGLIYGMGVEKLSFDLGLSIKEGKQLFAFYHDAVPFAGYTMNACQEEAERYGYITTILGRRSRFDYWEPTRYGTGAMPLPYARALAEYGVIKRAETRKALNRRLQGSAADLMKLAMLECHKQGVFDYIGYPVLTVHDELDFSDPGGKEDGFEYMQHLMQTALKLRVPIIAEGEKGPDWGHVK